MAVLPTIGAIVLHCVGINFARWSNFSSSSFDHSIFRMPGSSHSDHRALHCFGVFRASRDDTRAHWLRPYFETEALRISSSMLVLESVNKNPRTAWSWTYHTPPFTTGISAEEGDYRRSRVEEDEGPRRDMLCIRL